ncbi:MAG: YbiU family protein, partial [Hyphomicrobiales bacterium]
MDDEIKTYIRATKQRLRTLQDVTAAFQNVRDHTLRDMDVIAERAATGQSTIPELSYDHILNGKVSDAQRTAIRHSGSAIIRGVFPRQQAED